MQRSSQAEPRKINRIITCPDLPTSLAPYRATAEKQHASSCGSIGRQTLSKIGRDDARAQ